MASQAFLICAMFLLSAVSCLPLDSSPASTTTEIRIDHSNGVHQTEEAKDTDKEEDKITSTLPDESTIGDRLNNESTDGDGQQVIYCSKTINITRTYQVFTIINGKFKIINRTLISKTKVCCEGYELVGGLCRLDLCKGKSCKDPNSKCVTVERCGQLLPVFVTNMGIISTACTQPPQTREHLNLCQNATAVCEATPHCSGSTNREAVCFNTKCDCTPDRTWLKVSGDYADC